MGVFRLSQSEGILLGFPLHAIAALAREAPHAYYLCAPSPSASLLVMPSLSEAFGLALVEGMASGLPIVASRVGGIPEAVQGGDAFLLPPGDEEALAAAILQVLSNPARAVAMGQANWAAAANFDWDVIAGRYQRLYEQAIAEPGDG